MGALVMRPIVILGLDCGNAAALEDKLRQQPEIFQQADEILAAPKPLAILRKRPEFARRLSPLEFPLAKISEKLTANIAAGKRSLVLANGDPLFYGIGSSLLKCVDSELIEIVPAISSLQAVCSRLGRAWHNMLCLSLHGRADLAPLFGAIRRKQPLCLLLGNGPGPDAVARLLLDRGVKKAMATVVSSLGMKSEEIGAYSLVACARRQFPSSCLMLLDMEASTSQTPTLSGKYRSNEVVAGLAVRELAPDYDDIVWDVGSGSGSIALALARQAPDGACYAIERRWDRILDIQLNREFAVAPNLVPVYGNAPESLENLPMPQKIFIGGGVSEKNGSALLEACFKRLAPGGRLAASCLLLESLNLCRGYAKSMGLSIKIWQAQASRLASLGNGEMLRASNPVFVLALEKPGER